MTDLVGLLYHADWTRLSLAAEVTARRDIDLDRTRWGAGTPPREAGSNGKWPRTSRGWSHAGPRC